MAVGDSERVGKTTAVKLLEGASVANGVPTLATDGAELNRLVEAATAINASLLIDASFTGGTPTLDGRLWLYSPHLDEWVPPGIGTGAAKGTINDGSQLTITDTNKIVHAEPVALWRHFTRAYLEIVAIAGTTPSVDAWLASEGRA